MSQAVQQGGRLRGLAHALAGQADHPRPHQAAYTRAHQAARACLRPPRCAAVMCTAAEGRPDVANSQSSSPESTVTVLAMCKRCRFFGHPCRDSELRPRRSALPRHIDSALRSAHVRPVRRRGRQLPGRRLQGRRLARCCLPVLRRLHPDQPLVVVRPCGAWLDAANSQEFDQRLPTEQCYLMHAAGSCGQVHNERLLR